MIDIYILLPLITIIVLTIIVGVTGIKRNASSKQIKKNQTTLLKRYVLVTSFFTTTMITILLINSDLNMILYAMIWMFGFVIPYFGFCNAVNTIPKD